MGTAAIAAFKPPRVKESNQKDEDIFCLHLFLYPRNRKTYPKIVGRGMKRSFQYPITMARKRNRITSARFTRNSGALFLTHLK